MRTSWMPVMLLGLACAATAQVGAPTDPLSTRSGWEAGIQVSRYRYEEPDFMQLTGNRAGLAASYTGVDGRAFGRLDARYS